MFLLKILDRSTASKYARSRAYWEDRDYYSSDEDTYVDRTGAVERKRLNRMRQLGVNDNDEIKTTDELLNNDNAKLHLKNEKRISQNANMITMVCFVMCFTHCPCMCMYMSYQ